MQSDAAKAAPLIWALAQRGPISSSDDYYQITTDRRKLDVGAVHKFLSQSYWSPNVSFAVVERAIENSLCFSVLSSTDEQVGFARVVTDKATFAYLCDLYILESHRGRGLSKKLLKAIQDHEALQDLRWFLLATRDAHSLYEKFGFRELSSPSRLMEFCEKDNGDAA
jgi:GNAT superfamily N-acetyltransferase